MSSNLGRCFELDLGGRGWSGKVVTSQFRPPMPITRGSVLRDEKSLNDYDGRGGRWTRHERMTAVFLRTAYLLWGQGSWKLACWAIYLWKTWVFFKRSFSAGTQSTMTFWSILSSFVLAVSQSCHHAHVFYQERVLLICIQLVQLINER